MTGDRWTEISCRRLPSAIRSLMARYGWTFTFAAIGVRCQVSGAAHIPSTTTLFAANHRSHADTALVSKALGDHHRRPLLAAGADDYFYRRKILAWVVTTLVGVFPFPRSGPEGVVRARQLLLDGWDVLMFPEGTRSGGEFRPGVARIASCGVPVVPVGIAGSHQLLPPGSRWPRPARIRISFGAPMHRRSGEPELAFASRVEARVRQLSDGAS